MPKSYEGLYTPVCDARGALASSSPGSPVLARVAERLQALLRFDKAHPLDEEVAREIVKQLLAGGADEKSCALLLVPSEERQRRGR